MMKNFILLIIFIFLTNCGFEPIYSKKNLDIKINKIVKENTLLNNEISNALLNIYNDLSASKVLNIKIDTKKSVNVKSKNKKGDPSNFELLIKVDFEAIDQSDKKYSQEFSRKINFNNNDDKFQLAKYQLELEKILTKKLIEDIINYLANAQWS